MEFAGLECLLISLSNYFIKLVGADFVAWFQQVHGNGSNLHLALFGYYDSAHRNILKFATDFKSISVLESGRSASKFDLTHLKRAATVIKNMTEHFQGLFAMGVPDTLPISIIPLPLVPTTVVIQRHPPKRDSPVNQEPREEGRHPGQGLKLASVALDFDPKEKG